jgi:hypothetical protein
VSIERHRETYGPAIQILEKKVAVVIGTGGDAEFKAAADRIGKLVAHDIYLYGRHDVEVITDREYHARIRTMEHRDDAGTQLERTNLVLIGDAHLNRVTHHVLAKTGQEGKCTVVKESRWQQVSTALANLFLLLEK